MTTSPFDSALERREASLLGMWAFLATELMFFGPLFFGYVHARIAQGDAFVAGSHHMHIVLGTLNTAILMTSSLTMALAVRAARDTRPVRTWLALTALLGLVFLGIMASVWLMELGEAANASGGEARFYFLYFGMTGLHALHLTIGIGVACTFARRLRSHSPAAMRAKIEGGALYWHFVDAIWVVLFPLLYLLERHG